MEKENLLFYSFAQDLLDYAPFNEWLESVLDLVEVKPKSPDYKYSEDEMKAFMKAKLKGCMKVFESGMDYSETLPDQSIFSLAHACDKESFIEYLNYYYDSALKYYNYWEYEHCGFGSGFPIFWVFNPFILLICIKYFISINENEKAILSALFLMCELTYEKQPNDKEIKELWQYEACERQFEGLKDYIGNDWQAIHPIITRNIGLFYSKKGEYDKAFEYFSLGASIDYEGRQSQEPFSAVAQNLYALGLLYYKGRGTDKNLKEALKYIEMACDYTGCEVPLTEKIKEELEKEQQEMV